MEYVQKVKGTKVVVTLFSQNVGDDLPDKEIYHEAGTSSDPEKVRPAIKAYAEDIMSLVVEWELVRFGQIKYRELFLSRNFPTGLDMVLWILTAIVEIALCQRNAFFS